MDNVHSIGGSGVQFGFDLEPEVNAHLQRAAMTVADRKTSLEALNEARRNAPDQLEVLVSLYKFHFYQGDTEKAQDIVFQALIKSSRQEGFSHNWNHLHADSADWSNPRSAARIYLYSLKALAFIRLRQNDIEDAESILAVLDRLDPLDRVGANVIRELLAGLLEETDG
ncbi:MAG: hypothetical protein ABW090_05390 [Sedimenticola sp.]